MLQSIGGTLQEANVLLKEPPVERFTLRDTRQTWPMKTVDAEGFDLRRTFIECFRLLMISIVGLGVGSWYMVCTWLPLSIEILPQLSTA